MTLIDKEELMNDLNISWGCSGCKNDSGSFCKLEYDVTKVCKKIRSAKEQKIIRCRDCKWWYKDADSVMSCEYTDMSQPEDGFCNRAERRGDEE